MLLGAFVLAAVVSSPAQAANTASEALVDTDNDNVAEAREFGGRDRYDTALRLAQNFGASKGLGNVPEACVPADGDLTVAGAVTASGDQDASTDKVRDGNTKMAIEATFSGYVATVTSSTLLADVFTAAAARNAAATPDAVGLPGTVGDTVTGPIRTVRYVASTEDLGLLLRPGDRFDVEAGVADGYADDDSDTPDIDESANRAQTNFTISSGATPPR